MGVLFQIKKMGVYFNISAQAVLVLLLKLMAHVPWEEDQGFLGKCQIYTKK